jgi:anti-sigma factor RsiW
LNSVVTEDEIQAYADGVLPTERRAAVEAWLAVRPEEAKSVEIYRQARERLRAAYDPVLSEPLPPRFARVPRWPSFKAAAGLLVSGLVFGIVAGWQIPPAHTGAQMVHRAALVHTIYAGEVRHPVEVRAEEQAHLVAWLSKRLGMKVTAPNLEAAGLSLVGGRLLPDESGPAAALMYETRDGRRATLYWAPDAIHEGKVKLRSRREGNVAVFYWIDDECGYAVASVDLSHDELKRIAVMAHDQLEN